MPIRRILTTRNGGASAPPFHTFNLSAGVGDSPDAVRANRSRLAGAAGLDMSALVFMDQVHGNTVGVVTGAQPRSVPATDGIVTATPGLGLVVLVADCVPLLMSDPEAGVIAAVHAGRRGAAAGVVAAALNAMCRAGADVTQVEVLVGPAICGSCYEVPADMRDEVEAALPGSACWTSAGTPGLDLRAGMARQLREAGARGVVVDPRCTFTDAELFSHRRGAPTGRFAGLIWID